MAELIREGELLYFYEEDHDFLLVKFCIACKDTDLAYTYCIPSYDASSVLSYQ